MYIQAINPIENSHLQNVIATMRDMGAPEIRVYNTGEMFLALEGSHRLAAAWELGIEPILVEMGEEDAIDHDVDVQDENGDTPTTVVGLLSSMAMHTGETYEIEQFNHKNRF